MVLAHIWAFLLLLLVTGKSFSIFGSHIYLSGFGQNCFDSPGERGPCKAAFTRWTFNGGSCSQFLYGGCRGNGNRFDSQSQCQAVCGGGSRGNQGGFVTGGTARVGSPCNQSPFVFGSCQASLRRWTYVWQTRSCQPFTYSGCTRGAVENRFNTFEQCVRTCVV